jgi:hypothetical protein
LRVVKREPPARLVIAPISKLPARLIRVSGSSPGPVLATGTGTEPVPTAGTRFASDKVPSASDRRSFPATAKSGGRLLPQLHELSYFFRY